MLDLGWTELLVIGIVALIVVGPKDLPVMFRTLGRFTGKMRAMARDFTRAMDEAADQSGARDIARDLRGMSNPRSAAAQKFKKSTGLDEFDDFDLDDEGARDTTGKTHATAKRNAGDASADTAAGPADETAPQETAGKTRGPETAALAEKRAAEARARREEAVRRANERAASYKGFDGAAEGTSPAPSPGEDAPARRAETVGGGSEDAPREPAPDAEPKQDKA